MILPLFIKFISHLYDFEKKKYKIYFQTEIVIKLKTDFHRNEINLTIKTLNKKMIHDQHRTFLTGELSCLARVVLKPKKKVLNI